MTKFIKRLSHEKLLYLLLPPFYLLVFLPFLQVGFYWDDLNNSLIKGVVEMAAEPLWRHSYNFIVEWVEERGRFFPIAIILEHLIFYFFNDPFYHQIVRVIFIFASIVSCAWMVKLISGERCAGLLTMFLMPMFFSFQTYCDPLSSFGVLFPVVVIFSTLAISFYIKSQQADSKLFCALSLLFMALGMITYEITLAAFSAIILLAWRDKKSGSDFLKKSCPYILLIVFYLIACFVIRHLAKHIYNGSELGKVAEFPATFMQQVFATLPLNSLIFERLVDVEVVTNFSYGAIFLLFVISFIALILLLPTLVKNLQNRYVFNYIGWCFLLIPAAMISVMWKYQVVLFSNKLGYGYLPIYMQYFGLFLLLLSWLGKTFHNTINHHKTQRIFGILLALIFSLIISYSVILNYKMVAQNNKDHRFAIKELAREAMQQQILSGVKFSTEAPKNPLILNSQNLFEIKDNSTEAQILKKYPTILWSIDFPPEFILQNSGLVANIATTDFVMDEAMEGKYLQKNFSADQEIYIFDVVMVGDLWDGYVVFGKAKNIKYFFDGKKIVVADYSLADERIFINYRSRQNFGKIVEITKKRNGFDLLNIPSLRAQSGNSSGKILVTK